MRTPKYLSPTALHTYEFDPEKYYLRYLSDNRPPREPQFLYMAAGSAFDAYVKNYLHETVYGKGFNVAYSLDALLESQLDPNNRIWGREHGLRMFTVYKDTGALADLARELGKAATPPIFEFSIEGTINGVPLLGKPDVFFTSSEGVRVVPDFKVNGYMSKASPTKGYIKIRPGNLAHKDAIILIDRGIHYNAMCGFEEIKPDWADQLSTYAALVGATGDDWILGIEQIVNNAGVLRVASHRAKVGIEWQTNLMKRYKELWERITSGHFFSNLTLEQSKARCETLDRITLQDDDFKEMFR